MIHSAVVRGQAILGRYFARYFADILPDILPKISRKISGKISHRDPLRDFIECVILASDLFSHSIGPFLLNRKNTSCMEHEQRCCVDPLKLIIYKHLRCLRSTKNNGNDGITCAVCGYKVCNAIMNALNAKTVCILRHDETFLLEL